jgi:hypothetical protein
VEKVSLLRPEGFSCLRVCKKPLRGMCKMLVKDQFSILRTAKIRREAETEDLLLQFRVDHFSILKTANIHRKSEK